MSYDVSAFYVTETHLKNRLKTDVKPGGGILSGGNGALGHFVWCPPTANDNISTYNGHDVP